MDPRHLSKYSAYSSLYSGHQLPPPLIFSLNGQLVLRLTSTVSFHWDSLADAIHQMKRGKRMEKLLMLLHVHWNELDARLAVFRYPHSFDRVEETPSLISSHPPISSVTHDFDPLQMMLGMSS